MAAKADAWKARIAERRQDVLRLRRSGATLRAIAQQLDIPLSTANSDLKAVLHELHERTIDLGASLRELELERIDHLLLKMAKDQERIDQLIGQVEAGDRRDSKRERLPSLLSLMQQRLNLIDRVAKLSEQRSKLLGLYAPVKQEVTGTLTWEQVMQQRHDESDPFA